MANDLLYPGSILALHRQAVERLLSAKSSDAALLYLCLMAEQDVAGLQWPADRLNEAHQCLLHLHLVDASQPLPLIQAPRPEDDRPPDYTSQDISQALSNNQGFAALLHEVERLLGKVLSYQDQTGLYLILDYYALPPEVILTLVEWCLEKTARAYGQGRKPTLPQIKREAYQWYRSGINTLEAADEYLHQQHLLIERTRALLACMDIYERDPTPKEGEYLSRWVQLGFSDELVRLAYQNTLFQKGKHNLAYTNAILNRWYSQGLTTPEQVEAAEHRKRHVVPSSDLPDQSQPKTKAKSKPKTPTVVAEDVDRFFREAQRANKT